MKYKRHFAHWLRFVYARQIFFLSLTRNNLSDYKTREFDSMHFIFFSKLYACKYLLILLVDTGAKRKFHWEH